MVAFLRNIVVISICISCTYDKQFEPFPHIVQGMDLAIGHKIDQEIFMTNCFMYKTQAGYPYSITKLVYYLSQISLIKPDSGSLLLKDYLYVDAVLADTVRCFFKNIPAGNYIGLKFNIGLDSTLNVTDFLPSTIDNINMQWPEPMGGGYHFMKLEGYFTDNLGTYGYAMHLGTNNCMVPIKLYQSISMPAQGKVFINLVMNINEWFRNPFVYDFNIDGNYIMGNQGAMKKIAQNGVDVFSF